MDNEVKMYTIRNDGDDLSLRVCCITKEQAGDIRVLASMYEDGWSFNTNQAFAAYGKRLLQAYEGFLRDAAEFEEVVRKNNGIGGRADTLAIREPNPLNLPEVKAPC